MEEVNIKDSINDLFREFDLLITDEVDNAFIAGWLQGSVNRLGKCGMSIRFAQMCIELQFCDDIYKSWAFKFIKEMGE